jgi:hypothetical protein
MTFFLKPQQNFFEMYSIDMGNWMYVASFKFQDDQLLKEMRDRCVFCFEHEIICLDAMSGNGVQTKHTWTKLHGEHGGP